ncbi:hypothetical protein [Oceaniglobus ichthyenteri]|uniref:hypothetical protein n=1 Tax=Oceaniglobus ichthyenteri TaxID=2136177 RepID=UPI000D362361|nr:hypothetical protein [Oceaniglobus ichthyenteri]
MPRLAVFLLLMACSGYPDLGPSPSATARADYPRLIPLTPIVDGAKSGWLADPTQSRDLVARAQRLRARALAMRASAVSPADKARMRAAVARHSR